MLLENSPWLRYGAPFLSIVFGAAFLGSASNLFNENELGFLIYHPRVYTEVTGINDYENGAIALMGCVIGGGLLVASALIGFIGAFTRVKYIYYLFFVLALAGSLACVFAPLIFMQVLPMVGSYTDDDDDLYYAGNPNGDFRPNDIHKGMIDYGIAIFNECCVTKNWISQGALVPCSGDNAVDCPAITNPRINQYIPPELLCTCATSQERLDEFSKAVQDNNICSIMSNIYIDATEINIPTLSENIKISNAVEATYEGADMSKVPLIGFQEDPRVYFDDEYFPNATADSLPKYGFGCGVGLVKGVMYFTHVYYRDVLQPVANASIAVGVISCLVLGLIIFIGYVRRAEELEDAMEKSYLTDRPADYAVANFTQSLPGSSAASSVVSHASTVASEESKRTLVDQLRTFYTKHDPNKSIEDVNDVAQWAVTTPNGLNLLNDKLQKKYNTDLSSIVSVEVGGTGNYGAKVMSDDLEL